MAVQMNLAFLRSPEGIIKILEVIFSFLGMLMYLIYNSRDDAIGLTAFWIGTVVALIVSLILLLFYFLGLSEIFGSLMNLQTYFHLVWMFYILAYSSILLYVDTSYFDRTTAGIFGILLSITFLVDSLHGFTKYPPMPF
ncbi:hypothetical protein WA026_003344 [Henosepilachna vigintioctopunctata]|uniref:MARVEL domain-containing protein n=1 Tax=Henosepilachna vigintioctopunctata TaxID=420089 RepID=A0AAW1TR24_9CUCU